MSERKALLVGIGLVVALATPSHAQQSTPQGPPLPAGPLTLDQVLTLAEARSESVGIAERGVDRARGEQVRARSGLLPQLTVSAGYDRALASEFSGVFGSGSGGPPCPPFTLQPGAPLDERVAEIERAIDCGAIASSLFGGGEEGNDLPFGRENTWRFSLAFSQSIYSGGRLGAQAAIAAAGYESAELGLETSRAQLLFEATQAFYDAALSERLVRIAEATLEQAEATVRQVQAGFEAGAQPEFELLRARVTRDNQRPPLIRQRANRDIAFLRLKQLLDLPPEYDLQIAAPFDAETVAPPEPFAAKLPPGEVQPQESAVTSRTAVREVATLVRLREASLRLVEAERRPSIAVTSNYTQVAYPSNVFPTGDFRTNWTVGANLTFPVLTGGRQRGSEMVARAEVEQSRLQLRQVEELARLDVESAYAELAAARAALDASAGTVEQARRAYEIAEVRFQSGVSTQLELTDARLLLQQAEANRAQAVRDVQVARARIALLPDLPIGGAGAAAAAPSTSTAPPQGSQPAVTSAPPGGAGASAGGFGPGGRGGMQ